MKRCKAILRPFFTVISAVFFVSLLAGIFVGCTTVHKQQVPTVKAVLIEHPERMFWEIKREDTSIFILGTIHLADRTFFPLEDKIMEAFSHADRLVSELGGLEEMKNLPLIAQKEIIKNMNLDKEKNLKRFLSEEEIRILETELGDTAAKGLFMFNPWVTTIAVTNLIYQKAGLNKDDGIDLYLMTQAGSRKIEALETAEMQLSLLSMGTFEEQLEILHAVIEQLKNPSESIAYLEQIKKFYLGNNRKDLANLQMMELSDIPPNISEQRNQQFKDALLKDRNTVWAKKFAEYLNKGGSTFVFAGTGHFLGEDSVFEQLRQNGILE